VVVEREVDAGTYGQVRRDVRRADLDLAVLHVLGVDEEDVLEQAEPLQQRSAHQTVEVGPGDEAMTGRGIGCHAPRGRQAAEDP
jgi:hypothetical protein